jgi:3-dehydroquinate synthase
MSPSIVTDPFRIHDTIELPEYSDVVIGRAARRDSYPIHVTRSMHAAMERLRALIGDAAVAVITDETVNALYGTLLLRALRGSGTDVLLQSVPGGEASKNLAQATRLWEWLASSPIARRDVVVAFGGGVVCDLGGWVASGYMRGLPYVNLPTTLLAMVDGAIGGKVAVNHPVAKNLLGAFYQPAGVVANVGFLRSLERRQLRAGLAECIKKAMIASPDYLAFIEDHADALLACELEPLERLVGCAAAIKTALIERDPYELDLRRPLNFGHTIGHPVETVTGYGPLLHGEAVAFGMVVESRIAASRGLVVAEHLDRLLELLRRCRLPTTADEVPVKVTADDIVAATEKVRLIRAGSLRVVLPVEPGETVIADDVTPDEVRAALRACGVK